MKRIIILGSIVAGLLLAGCNSAENNAPSVSDQYLGTWSSVYLQEGNVLDSSSLVIFDGETATSVIARNGVIKGKPLAMYTKVDGDRLATENAAFYFEDGVLYQDWAGRKGYLKFERLNDAQSVEELQDMGILKR
jgi:hypothetical protein